MEVLSPDAAAVALLLRQHGYGHVRQLYDVGLTKDQISRRVARGVLTRDGHGVVCLPGRGDALEQRAMRAVLLAGTGAMASLWTAAQLHGLETPLDGHTHVVIEGSPRVRDLAGIRVHRSRSLPPDHTTIVAAVPTTSLPRTLVDCATHLTPAAATRMLDSASPSSSTWRSIHATAVALSNGRAGVRFVADITAPGGAHRFRSTLERRARAALHGAEVQDGCWNTPVHDASGHVREVDLCYPDARVVVEFDGLRFHERSRDRRRDRATDRRLQLAGWRVLRFTWSDVIERPDRLVRDVQVAVARNGRS